MNLREEKTDLVLNLMFEQYEEYCDELQKLPFHEQMEYAEESYFYQEMLNYFQSHILEERAADRLVNTNCSLKKLYLTWRNIYGKRNDTLILKYMATAAPATHILDWRD